MKSSRASFLYFVIFLLTCSQASAARIRGMIVRDGIPVPSMKVRLRTSEGKQFPATFTDDKGFYYYEAVPEHDLYLLKVWVTDEWAVDRPIIVYAGKFTDITPIRFSSKGGDRVWLGEDEVRNLIENYWTFIENKNIESVVALHSDPCDFYDDGYQSRAYIQARKRDYIKGFPNMQLKPHDIEVFDGFSNGEKTATFTLSYNVKTKAGQSKTGTTRQTWTLVKGEHGTVINSCKELLKRKAQ